VLKTFGLSVAAVVLALPAVLSAQDYEVVAVRDGGTITGTVKWAGPMPRLAPVAINKDPLVCDPDSKKTRDLERLIIGPHAGVANTVVFLKDISRGKAMDLPQQRRFLDQRSCRYEPHILLVPANSELQMKSSDATLHTIHMDGAATYNLPFPFVNQTVARKMPSVGLVSLRCNGGHTWMNAEMFVVPHPYYAVTDTTGKFELSDVPPGEYQIVAWHEGWNVMRQEAAYDVLTEKRTQRPIFAPARTWEKKVSVQPNSGAEIHFVISEK
jgi:hypothetical protein